MAAGSSPRTAPGKLPPPSSLAMNVTVALLLAPLALWVMPIHVPPGVNATVVAHLPQICNATGTAFLKGPATYTITCTNPTPSSVQLLGSISVEYASPPVATVLESPTSYVPLVATAATAAAAGASLAYSRREELAASLLAVVGRIKRATAEAPVRRGLIKIIEESGAITAAQLVKRTGLSWGQVQWHLYVLEREGKVKSVKIGPFLYYFVDPRTAARVILSSVDRDLLTSEDREKLDFMARP